MTGGDRLSARYLYAEWFEFTPVAKFWLATNHKPEVRGTGEAIWRRILLLPFTVTIPELERDRGLTAKLLSESAGVLAWAVEGALRWQQEGLAVPQIVRQATDAYRDEMDLLGDFINECCVIGDDHSVAARHIYDHYESWAVGQGIRLPMTQQKFGTLLGERGFERRRVGTKKTNIWVGIGVPGAPRLHTVEGTA